MSAPISPFLMSEEERARLLDLIRASRSGHIPTAAWVMDMLRKILFACGVEFLAALAPLSRRGDGIFSLAGSPDAECWPAGAARTADSSFAPGEVRVEGISGAWEDGNARQHAIAWGEAVAGRIWRRPDDPCPSLEAVERLFALAGIAILAERYAARGYRTDGADDLPFAADAPPLVPEMPSGEAEPSAAPEAPPPPAEDGPFVVLPSLVVDAVVAIADGLKELAENPDCADAIRAGGAEPDVVARASELVRGLAGRALDGEWGPPSAHHAERPAEVVSLARARRHRGRHLRAVPGAASPTAPAITAEGLRAAARTMREMARAASDPAQADALREAGLRPDLLVHGERHAARLLADADHIARLFAAGRNDPPPAA
ncbi:hypothetical protein ABLE93_20650 [Xanthobacter sp. KR7-65]|uniref:hypothetical protein n=1 Tax=Xanthobacter sp. KR7-65 TaxID=3156612 RepID=UPI0032B50E06